MEQAILLSTHNPPSGHGGDLVGPPVQAEPDSGPESARNRAFFFVHAAIAPQPLDGDRTVTRKREAPSQLAALLAPVLAGCSSAPTKRIWPIGWAPAFQAGQRSSILRIRSNSGVSEHLVPMIGRGNGWALCAGSTLWRSGRTGWPCTTPRDRAQPNWKSLPR